MREAAYSEQTATPPWFLAAAPGLWRAGRGTECLQARAVSVPDSLLHPPLTAGFHLPHSKLPWLALCSYLKASRKVKLFVLYSKESKCVKY